MGLGVAGAAVLVVALLTAVTVGFYVLSEKNTPVVKPVAVEVARPVVPLNGLSNPAPPALQDRAQPRTEVPASLPQRKSPALQVTPAAPSPKTARSPAANPVADKPSVSAESTPTANPVIQEPAPQQVDPETQNKTRELRDPWETP